MLYTEFTSATKCKQTDYNYSVYKALEALYMSNDKITKEAIYKAGALLIDNSETQAEKEAREKLETAIQELELGIATCEQRKKELQHALIDATDASMKRFIRQSIGHNVEEIKEYKAKIKALKTL